MWPAPSSIRPGQGAAPANLRPSRVTSPKWPSSMRIAITPSHWPSWVGSWLKSQGQPGSQLQFLNQAPLIAQVSLISSLLLRHAYPRFAFLACPGYSSHLVSSSSNRPPSTSSPSSLRASREGGGRERSPAGSAPEGPAHKEK